MLPPKTSAYHTKMTHSEPNVTTERLLGYISEIEKASSERDLVSERIRDIYAAADADGFDKKAIREAVKLRKQDPEKVKSFEQVREFYLGIAGVI